MGRIIPSGGGGCSSSSGDVLYRRGRGDVPWWPRVSTGGSLITSKCPGGSCHRGRPTGCGIKIIYDHGDGGLKAREASPHKLFAKV